MAQTAWRGTVATATRHEATPPAPPRSRRTRGSRKTGRTHEDTEDRAHTHTHCTSPPGGRRAGTGLVQRRVGLAVSFVGRRIIRRPGAAPGVGAAGALLSPEGVAGSRRPLRRDTPAKTGYRPGQGTPCRARHSGSDRQACRCVADSDSHCCSRANRCPAPRPVWFTRGVAASRRQGIWKAAWDRRVGCLPLVTAAPHSLISPRRASRRCVFLLIKTRLESPARKGRATS